MADLALWITPDHATADASGNVSNVYDRSGRGNHLVQYTADNKPHLAVVSNAFAGKKVFGFDQVGGSLGRSNTYIQDASADVENIFGTSVGPTTDPEFTVALVVNETGGSGTKEIFTIEENTGSGYDSFRVRRTNNGVGFYLHGDADASDEGDQTLSSGTPETIITVVSDIGSSMEVHQWVGGTANDWDDTSVGVNYAADPNVMFTGGYATKITLAGTKLGTSGAVCDISEVLVWKGAHTAAERTETLNYLRDRWDCN